MIIMVDLYVLISFLMRKKGNKINLTEQHMIPIRLIVNGKAIQTMIELICID